MKVIAFCSYPGGGKSTAIESIKDLGIIITMGDVIRNEAKKRNVEPTGENLGKIAKEIREIGGQDIIAIKCVDLIKKKNEEVIFIDGIRSISEVNVFRKIWKFPIIAIEIDEKKRSQRLFNRARSDDPKNLEDLRERDKREIEFGLHDVLSKADYIIKNDSTIEDLKRKTRKTVLEILLNY